jgi:uncharacterized membrane protein (UPF0127 family)
MRVVTVTDTTRGTLIGDRIEVADASLSRMVGLLGRRGLNAGGGLWITPSSGVHTLGMMFSIDVIGLDKEFRVVRLWPRLVPFRLTSVSLKVRSVVELEAGRIEACRVELGDLLQISS